MVSPEWVEQAGNLHDPDNPHNRQLFGQAEAWAESRGGAGSVIATRLDLDEKGGAVVDVLVSPVQESRGKPVICTNKALRELKETTGERNEYSALQTSWADWCCRNLDAEIVRGTRKEIIQRQHLSPETYGARSWTRPVRASERSLRGCGMPSGTQCQRRSKIPQFCGFGRQPFSVTCSSIFWWTAAVLWGGRRRYGCVGAGVFGDKVCVAAQAVACAFDLNDDSVVKQPVEKRGGDNGVPKYIAPCPRR